MAFRLVSEWVICLAPKRQALGSVEGDRLGFSVGDLLGSEVVGEHGASWMGSTYLARHVAAWKEICLASKLGEVLGFLYGLDVVGDVLDSMVSSSVGLPLPP